MRGIGWPRRPGMSLTKVRYRASGVVQGGAHLLGGFAGGRRLGGIRLGLPERGHRVGERDRLATSAAASMVASLDVRPAIAMSRAVARNHSPSRVRRGARPCGARAARSYPSAAHRSTGLPVARAAACSVSAAAHAASAPRSGSWAVHQRRCSAAAAARRAAAPQRCPGLACPTARGLPSCRHGTSPGRPRPRPHHLPQRRVQFRQVVPGRLPVACKPVRAGVPHAYAAIASSGHQGPMPRGSVTASTRLKERVRER
jgi:hypothetical protein